MRLRRLQGRVQPQVHGSRDTLRRRGVDRLCTCVSKCRANGVENSKDASMMPEHGTFQPAFHTDDAAR
jgi:hypothetical protein